MGPAWRAAAYAARRPDRRLRCAGALSAQDDALDGPRVAARAARERARARVGRAARRFFYRRRAHGHLVWIVLGQHRPGARVRADAVHRLDAGRYVDEL